jgi:hypothetical protein
MRDNALQWYKSLSTLPGVYVKSWNVIKEPFLLHYATKATAKPFCTNFKDLVQKPCEGTYDFYGRIAAVFIKIRTLVLNMFHTVRHGVDVDFAKDVLACKKEGLNDANNFFIEQLLLAEMHKKLWTKIQEIEPRDF